MYYIIETEQQLKEFKEKNYNKVFIEPIYFNDNFHPVLNSISLLYIKSFNNDKGYMLCINHIEALSLKKDLINELIESYEEIYVRDRKKFIYFFPLKKIIDINFYNIHFVEPKLKIETHYHQFNTKFDLNTIIPLTKHYEKCELIFSQIKTQCIPDKINYYNKLTSVFFNIENNGILINKTIFDEYHKTTNETFSIRNNTIYTQYNLYTTTARPSNSFNGINFAALKKDDGNRKAFIPRNDYFIEIDINAYHPTLVGKLIKFDFNNKTPYQYFAEEANIDIDNAKKLLLKQLYGGIYKEYKHIDFLSRVDSYTNTLWNEFESKGYVDCIGSYHRFIKNELKNMNPQKLLSYYIQNYETYNNINILWDIIKILKNKNTKIVLYVYDSILIDYDKNDNCLKEIKNIFDKNNLKIKITQGKNYGEMIKIAT